MSVSLTRTAKKQIQQRRTYKPYLKVSEEFSFKISNKATSKLIQLSFIISKKDIKTAVKRNKMKRRIRLLFRQCAYHLRRKIITVFVKKYFEIDASLVKQFQKVINTHYETQRDFYR